MAGEQLLFPTECSAVVRFPVRDRVKCPLQGRRKPYGAGAKHHYHSLNCPYCGAQIVSDYRIRHTYKSIWRWLRKRFYAERHFNIGKAMNYDIPFPKGGEKT